MSQALFRLEKPHTLRTVGQVPADHFVHAARSDAYAYLDKVELSDRGRLLALRVPPPNFRLVDSGRPILRVQFLPASCGLPPSGLERRHSMKWVRVLMEETTVVDCAAVS